ncbi:hypothetical protein KI387_006206, partial [Taxus chinensis]
ITSFFTALPSVRGTKRHLDTSLDSQTRFVRTCGATSQARGTHDALGWGSSLRGHVHSGE